MTTTMTTMIRPLLLFSLSLWLSCLVDAVNVAMTSSGIPIAIAVNGDSNFLYLSSDNGFQWESEEAPFLSGFDDVAIDPANENLVFALSTQERSVCAFAFATKTANGQGQIVQDPLELVTCGGVDTISVSPFTGVSAYGGTLVISGGTGGFSVSLYEPQSGVFTVFPSITNFRNADVVIGHPDVVLVSDTLAAFSTDFVTGATTSRFGTQMVTFDAASKTSADFGFRYPVEDTLGFEGALGPANFPLVNAVYRDDGGQTFLYTANGAMQAQDVSSSGVSVLNGPQGFSAVTVAVNQNKQWAVFGGVSAGIPAFVVYDLSADPLNPSLMGLRELILTRGDRITSIATSGCSVAVANSLLEWHVQFETISSDSCATVVATGPATGPATGSNEIASGGSALLAVLPRQRWWHAVVSAGILVMAVFG